MRRLGSTHHLYQEHKQNTTVPRLASMKFPFAFILASTIVAIYVMLVNNKLEVVYVTEQ